MAKQRICLTIAGILTGLCLSATTYASEPIPVLNGNIRLVEPASLRIAKLERIIVEVRNYQALVLVLIDGVDYSALLVHQGDRWILPLPGTWSRGEHRVEVIAAGMPKGEWLLTVNDEPGQGHRRTLTARSNISLSASHARGTNVNDKSTHLNGNISLNVGVHSGNVELSAETSANYSNTATQRKLVPSGYLLKAKRDNDTLSLGDVSFRGTPLTASSLSRRGAVADLNWDKVNLQLLQVSSSSLTGWNSGVGKKNRISGGAVTYTTGNGGDQPTRLVADVLNGRIINQNSANVSSIEAPSSGTVVGLLGSGQAAGLGYNAELGISKYDADTTDSLAAKHDRAMTLQVDKVISGISFGAHYLRAGSDYASIADPGAVHDREEYALTSGTSFGSSGVSATVSRAHDNLNSDASRPVVYNDNLGLTYALTVPKWPSISLSYMAGRVFDRLRPIGASETSIDNNTLGASLSYGGDQWSNQLNMSNSKINDALHGDSSSHSATWSGNVQTGAAFSLSSTLSYVQNLDSVRKQEATLATVSTDWRVAENVSLAGMLAWNHNLASDNSTNNNKSNASLRMAYDITKSLKRYVDKQQASLSLSYVTSKVTDRINAANTLSSYSILLGVNISAPFEGSYHF